MTVMKAIQRISDRLDKICGTVCMVLLAAMVLVTGAQIICRVFFTALPWSEELTRYMMVWATFIGASCVYKHAGHISVTLVQDMFPKTGQRILQTLVHLLCGALFAAAVWFGVKYMGKQAAQLSAALRMPMKWVYLSIPVGCAVMLVHILDALTRMVLPGKEVGTV